VPYFVVAMTEMQQLANAREHLDVGRGVSAMDSAGRRRHLRRGTQIVLELVTPVAQGRRRHGELAADLLGTEYHRAATRAASRQTHRATDRRTTCTRAAGRRNHNGHNPPVGMFHKMLCSASTPAQLMGSKPGKSS
jgi:hypothetical protein